MQTTNKPILSGIVSGQVAGLIMAIVVMLVFTVFLGKSPFYPVQVIGSALFGEAALQGTHFGAILAGLLLHQLGPSLLWGVLFGLIATRVPVDSIQKAAGIGIVVGILSMAGPYLLIPFIFQVLHGVDIWNREVPMFWDWAAHIIFGISFCVFPKIQGKLS